MRPGQLAEHSIITSILDGEYMPGGFLPAERELAETIGVARPPLRETLQRLSREGWLTISHGKPTRVNDYWDKGGMGLLSTLAKYTDQLPNGFITHLLEVRSRLLPIIAKLAAENEPDKLVAYLENATHLDDLPDAFIQYDWQFQILMTRYTRNPIYKLILNDFQTLFETLAVPYFRLEKARVISRKYYQDMKKAIKNGGQDVERVVQDTMNRSIEIWQIIKKDLYRP